jgi:hypothetical protein
MILGILRLMDASCSSTAGSSVHPRNHDYILHPDLLSSFLYSLRAWAVILTDEVTYICEAVSILSHI